MSQMKVIFQSPEEILDFVNKIGKCPYHCDLKRGRFTADAKSLLGTMNMGLKTEIVLKVYGDDCESLEKDIKPYIAA